MKIESEVPPNFSSGKKQGSFFSGDESFSDRITEKIKYQIENSPARLQRELSESGNSWIASFATDVTTISGLFEMLAMADLEYKKKNEGVSENLQAILKRFREVRKEYGYEKEIPTEIKEELSLGLNIFRES